MTVNPLCRSPRAAAVLACLLIVCLVAGTAGCSTQQRVERLIQNLDQDELAGGRKAVQDLVEIGEPAVEPLIAALDDPEVAVRRRATAVLGQIGDARAVEPLVSTLSDDANYYVREAAALALGQIGDGRAVEPLIAALGDPLEGVRAEAARALGRIGEPRAGEALFAAFEGEVAEGQAAGLAIMEALVALDDPRAADAAVRVLGSRNIHYQEAAQEILAAAGPQGVTALLNGLAHADEGVRAAAAERLAAMDEGTTLEGLVEALASPDEGVRSAAVELLDGMSAQAGVAAADALLAQLNGADQEAAVAALETLGAMLGGKHAAAVLDALAAGIEPLLAFLEHPQQEVRATAAWLLARTGDPRAADALYGLRGDPDQAIRWAALWALVEQGDPRAPEALVDALAGDQTDPLQAYAADALAGMGAQAVDSLIAALEGGDATRRAQIARLLGTIGEAKAVPGLAALLADDSDAVRRAAAMALGEIGDPAGFEPLVEACQDADVDVRRAAAVGLNRMDDALLAPLLDALASGDLATVARAHMFYIVRGQAGAEDVLVEALAQHGTKEMALDYMNSGHGPLAEAGKAWAKEHGYIVVPLPGGSGAGKWGSGP